MSQKKITNLEEFADLYSSGKYSLTMLKEKYGCSLSALNTAANKAKELGLVKPEQKRHVLTTAPKSKPINLPRMVREVKEPDGIIVDITDYKACMKCIYGSNNIYPECNYSLTTHKRRCFEDGKRITPSNKCSRFTSGKRKFKTVCE